MNRFIPDSLLEALLRPLAMAAPNGWVYMEVIAPDLRFVFLALLLVLCAGTAWKTKKVQPVLWALAVFLAVSFVPWLLTSGNGRYFIPMLMVAGILCVGLVHTLPFTRSLRASLAGLMVLLQGFAVLQNNPWEPWNGWGFHEWREPPYYPVLLDAEAREQAATYVTLSVVTYSLIAPQFAPGSRWLNLSSLTGAAEDSHELQRVKALLSSAERLRVVLPAASMSRGADGQPRPDAMVQLQKLMIQQHLKFADNPRRCRLLALRTEAQARAAAPGASSTPAARGSDGGGQPPGFWICQAVYVEAPPPAIDHIEPRAAEVFEVLERTCPRLFPAGQQQAIRIPSGLLRHYASADMYVYILNDGVVSYKYHRALNPETIGRVDDVLAAGFSMRCDQVRGRSGLPWDRDI